MGNLDRFNARRGASRAAWNAGGVFIDDSEINHLAADLGAASAEVTAMASAAVRKTLIEIEADAKAFAPVDTGFLKSSIGTDIDRDGLGGVVGPSASYGAYVELGTSTQAPQAYMGPALDHRSPGFAAAMEQLGGDIL